MFKPEVVLSILDDLLKRSENAALKPIGYGIFLALQMKLELVRQAKSFGPGKGYTIS